MTPHSSVDAAAHAHAQPATPGEHPVLVTGAAGFIGSHTAHALLARGQSVVGVDNFDPYYEHTAKRENVAETARVAARAGAAFELIQADICDADAMRRLFETHRPAGVIHLAAKAGVRPSIADPAGYARTNVYGTSVLLEEARRSMAAYGADGCSRFVMASSSSVYGNCPVAPFHEGLDVGEPISPYAATKRACELIAYTHWHLTRMPTACLRFFTVFGPGQRPDLAIALFLRSIAEGRTITMFGDGSASRDYTYIDDIVRGVLAAYDRVGEHGYRVWNLGGSEPVTLREMIQTVSRVVGREPRIDRRPMQPGDVERTFADMRRAEAELGFRASVRLEEGIRRQFAWMRETGRIKMAGA